MIRTELPLVGGSGGYFGQQLDPAQTINMFIGDAPGTSQKALITIPGSVTVSVQGGKDTTRALFENTDTLFGVLGDSLIGYDSDFTSTTLGSFGTSAGYVAIQANNSKQIMFVDNVNGWIYDFSGAPTFTQIADPAFTGLNGPVDIDFLDGYMIVGFSSSNQWAISNIDDASSWNALNRARLTSSGNERITGIRILEDLLFIFGRKVTEIWSVQRQLTSASSTFPFVRESNLTLQYGCAATGSIARGNLSSGSSVLVWLASNKSGAPTVRLTTGGQSVPISNASIEYRLEQLTTLSDARAYIFQSDGHIFYLITFPTEDLTLVYDFDTKEWHDQQMLDGGQYFSSCHAYFQNKHILGHTKAGKISHLSSDFTKNDAESIHCVRTTPIITLPEQLRQKASRLQLEVRQGTGIKTSVNKNDNDFDPKIYMSFSVDGGYKFGQQIQKTTGKVGETTWLTVWTNFPITDRSCWRFESFNGVKSIWLNLAVQLTEEPY